MLSRFLLSTLVLLLYMGALAVPLLFMVKTIPEENMGTAAVVFMVLAGGLMLPLMDWCAKNIFYFEGAGQPVPEQDLRKELMSINSFDVPIVAMEKGDTIEITWNYLDTKWQGMLSSHSMSAWFKVTLRFDPPRHRVTMLDTHGRLNRGVRGDMVRWSWFRGIYMNFVISRSLTVRRTYRGRTDYENLFETGSIHNPVMNTILNSGWDVRFALL